MIWHIVRKDWRLLAPFVIVLALVQALIAIARFKSGHFLNALSPIVTGPGGSLLILLAVAIAIVLVAHQDPVPGVRQDWLVRPIRRRDLFAAKLLFVVAFIQGPMLVTDLLQGVANGFSFGESAGAAIACAAWILLTLSVPVLAFATLTATMTETLVASLGVLALIIAFLAVPSLAGVAAPTALSGFAWVPSFLREGVLGVAAVVVLILQYGWRRTMLARALFAGALIAGQGATFIPWTMAWRLEQGLSARAAVDSAVSIVFAPAAGRYRLAPGQGIDDVLEKPGVGPADVAAANERRRAEGAITVFLPLRIAGLAAQSRLLADRSQVVLRDRDGRVVHRGTGNDLEFRQSTADAPVHHGIRVPGAVYNRFKNEPLQVSLDYSFTLFGAQATYALAAQNADQRMPGVGWCATAVNDSETRVLLRCLQPGERPSCLSLVLEHSPTGRRNPEVSLCVPDYAPYPGHVLPDAVSRFGGSLPFYDPSGLMRYPVGGLELPQSRVLVTRFEPIDHFVQRIVIRDLRLEQWQAAIP